MDNIVDISILCSLDFYEEGYVNPAPYNTHYADDWAYPDTIPDNYEPAEYYQPFQQNDIIYLPLLSNYAPHNFELIDCHGNQIATFQSQYIQTSIEGTGQKFYLTSVALNGYAEGVYRFRLKSGNPILKTMVTSWFKIKTKHNNSVLLKYKHNENDYDMIFETGIELMMRTFGGFPPEGYKPGSDRTIFIDQARDAILLSGKVYDIDKLIVGDAGGVPKYVIRKINAILQCSDLTIDGKGFVGNEGANWEAVTEADYPMAGWGIDLRPTINSTKKRFVADGNSNNPSSLVYGIEGDGFGQINGPASSNVVQIIKIGA